MNLCVAYAFVKQRLWICVGARFVHLTGFSCAARVGTLLQSFYRRRRQAKYFTTRYVAISSKWVRERERKSGLYYNNTTNRRNVSSNSNVLLNLLLCQTEPRAPVAHFLHHHIALIFSKGINTSRNRVFIWFQFLFSFFLYRPSLCLCGFVQFNCSSIIFF